MTSLRSGSRPRPLGGAPASRRHDRGFTLVEILIAIVLVGILSAVVVVGVGQLTSKGATAACTSSSDAARAATMTHLTSTGQMPSTFSAMVSSGALTLPSGVTVDSTGRVLSGSGWTLTMAAGPAPTFTCATTSSGSGSPGATVVDGAIGLWALDETTDTTATDASSTGTTLTWSSGAVASVAGVHGSIAASFTSTTSLGLRTSVVAGSPLDRIAAMSLEAWIKPSASGQNGGIVEKSIGTTVNTGYLLFLEGGQLVWRATGANGIWRNIYTGWVPPVGSWSHVVGTYDGTTLRAYANGVEVGAPVTIAAPLASGAGTFYIGQLGTGCNYAFLGALDDVAVYPTALTSAQVLAHYRSVVPA